MKIPFRHGIIDAQKNGLGQPQFILASSVIPGYLQLSATTTATSIAVAHGESNYLLTFNQTVDPAWGPLVPGINNYLYWDVDVQTAAVTYGITTIEPIVSATAPAAPVINQHWFDLSTTTMKMWNGTKWQTKIRLFAGMIPNGNINSDQATWCKPIYQPSYSAAELLVESNPGYIMTNMFGRPHYVNGSAFEFLTSDTQVRYTTTIGTSGVLSQPTTAIFPVKAAENIPRMSLVYFAGENAVGLASGNPAVNPPKIPVGIVQCELSAGEVGLVHQSGEISCDAWDWSSHIGRPLYCGDFGNIVTHRPSGLMAYRIGFVKNRNTIVFQIDAETLPQIYQSTSTSVIVNANEPLTSTFSVSPLNELIWTINLQESSASQHGYMSSSQAALLSNVAVRLGAAETDILGKAAAVHTHPISSITNLQTTLDGKSNVGHTHTEYAPLAHTHTTFAPTVHSHTIVDISGLQTELNGKAPSIHTHSITDVSGLTAALDGKITKVVGATADNFAVLAADGSVLDSSINYATLSTTFAFANHTHSISNVTGLQAALDGKASTSHNHDTQYAAISHNHTLDSLSDVSTSGAVSGMALTFNGTSWSPTTIASTSVANVKPAPLTHQAVTAAGSYDYGSALHHNWHVRVTAASAVTLLIQPDSFWTGSQTYSDNNFNPTNPGPMPVGGTFILGKHGAGNVVVQAGAGVTINTPDTLTISRLHGKATLIKVGPNEWDFEGNIGA